MSEKSQLRGPAWQDLLVIAVGVLSAFAVTLTSEPFGFLRSATGTESDLRFNKLAAALVLLTIAFAVLVLRKSVLAKNREEVVHGQDAQFLLENGRVEKVQAVTTGMTDRKQSEEIQISLEVSKQALSDYEHLVERIACLGQTLGNARDLTTIFRTLREFAVVSVPCDGMVISLYEPEKSTRRITYCWADNMEFDPKDLAECPVGNGLTGTAIKSGAVVFSNDYQQLISDRKPVRIGAFASGDVPQSALSAPMTFMGRTVGCVEIQTYKLAAYGPEHETAMRLAASLAASAVENVSLIERERAKEDQLRQSQKMEAIGQLAGGVAHDFNNLLTVITGYSELTLRKLAKDDPLRTYIEGIATAGARAAGLTRQLLAFSRRQMLQSKVLDLNQVVEEMDKLLQRLIGEDVHLASVLHPFLGQIKADPGQIEQVIMNLVVNARDALPKGGKITIETGHATLDDDYVRNHIGSHAGHFVVLSVSDNGIGMDAETQKRAFDPFFTTKEVGKGTGLGLSTVYGIVKQSEGSIWINSELGKGTSFKVYLPRIDEVNEQGEDDETDAATAGGRETVLLVEDDDMVRKLSRGILEHYGFKVLTASNGKEGLLICTDFKGRIDLVITDVVMPIMSGRELSEHLPKLRPETRVLFMSGYTDDAIVRHGILDEQFAFIQKPFLPDALIRKAREVLDRSP